MTRAGLEATIRERTGLLIDPYFSGSKIRWILERYPDTVEQARRGALLFGTIDTWLIWQLTGGAAHVTDPTNAARTLLYNIHEREWDPVLLEALDIPRAMLPEVRPSAGLFGETRVEAPVSGVPITGVAGDQQAALYGQGCWDPGMAKNTYGTGAFVVANLGRHRPSSHGGLLTTLACDQHGQPVYALEGSIFVAGALIQWFRDELGLLASAAESEAVATEVPRPRGSTSCRRSPVWAHRTGTCTPGAPFSVSHVGSIAGISCGRRSRRWHTRPLTSWRRWRPTGRCPSASCGWTVAPARTTS